MQDLRGNVVVITGGAEGIGRAVALRAASVGMRVVLGDVDAGALERTVAELCGAGAEAEGVACDVSNADSVNELARRARERFGDVSILVNNAGVASVHPAWDGPLDEWTRVIGVNLLGVVHGLRAFVPAMMASGKPGHVVNIASAAGLVSTPGLAAYCATKSAVVSLSEALLQDLRTRSTKIGVSVVCPSWVKTRIAGRATPPEATPADSFTQAIRTAIVNAVKGGIDPNDLATMILEAVKADRFYVLSHAPTKIGV